MVEGVQQGPVLVGTFFRPSRCSQSSMHTSPLPGPAGCSLNPVQRAQGAS